MRHQFVMRSLEVTALPMGQGLGLKIGTRGALINEGRWPFPTSGYSSNIIFDFGSNSKKHVQKCLTIVPSDITLLILSHFDVDHVSGVPSLLHRTKVHNLWVPGIGHEMRLSLAADTCLHAKRMRYSQTEQEELAHFIVSPTNYIQTRGYATEVRQVPRTRPPETPRDENSQLPPPETPEEEPEIHDEAIGEPRSFEVQFSESGKEVRMLAKGKAWFQLRVLVNGSRDASRDPNLSRYVTQIATAIEMTVEEIESDPAEAARRIAELAGGPKLKPLKSLRKMQINNTSMVVAARPVPFRGTLRWEWLQAGFPFAEGYGIEPWLQTTYHDIEEALYMLHHRRHFFLPTPANSVGSPGWPIAPSTDWSALFTGDAGKSQMERIKRLSIPILQVPHHGSRKSLSHKFYEKNMFAIGVLSYGSPNSYKHPDEDVLTVLNMHGVRALHNTQHVNWSTYHNVMDAVRSN